MGQIVMVVFNRRALRVGLLSTMPRRRVWDVSEIQTHIAKRRRNGDGKWGLLEQSVRAECNVHENRVCVVLGGL